MAVSLAVVVAACGGGDGGGPQTEQGALDAVRKAQKAVLDGDSGAVINFMSAECRELVDEDEVKLMVGLAAAFIGDEIDLDAVEVSTEIESFSEAEAEVSVSYSMPEESAVDDLFFDGQVGR
jgi:hypothetical protein